MSADQRWLAAWDDGTGVVITAPAEGGWSVQVDYVARMRDGSELTWSSTAYTPTSEITVVPSVPAASTLAPGAVALLIARVVAVDPDGGSSKRSLGGRVVTVDRGAWALSAAEWDGRILAQSPGDPHDGLELDSDEQGVTP